MDAHVVEAGTAAKQLKRHKEWTAFSVPLCSACIHAGHVQMYRIRYAVGAAADEVCDCPCRLDDKLEAA